MSKLRKLHASRRARDNSRMTEIMVAVKQSGDILQQQRDQLRAQGLKGTWEEFKQTAYFAESTAGLDQRTMLTLRRLWGALR